MNAFEVGVNIAFASNGAALLTMLDRHILGLDEHAKGLSNTLTGLRLAAVGAMTAVAGGVALDGLWKLTKAAAGLTSELQKIKNLGPEFAGGADKAYHTAVAVARAVPTRRQKGPQRCCARWIFSHNIPKSQPVS